MIPDDAEELVSLIGEDPPLEVYSSGYSHVIEFFGFCIWSSENDERPYINEDAPDEDLMPLEDWLRQEIKRILRILSRGSSYIDWAEEDSD